jgi:hypothetical protein
MKIKLLFSLFITTILYSQKIQILDSINNKPIPFVKILTKNNNIYITDSIGVLNEMNFEKSFYPIIISKTGYIDQTISKYKQNIQLSLKIKNIEEVKLRNDIVITKDKYQIFNVTTIKDNDFEYGIILYNKKEQIGKLKNIILNIKKNKGVNENIYLLLKFYPIDNENISTSTISTKKIRIIDLFINNNIDLKDLDIFFEKKIMLSLQVINENKNANIAEIKFYNSKKNTARYSFINKKWIKINEVPLIAVSYLIQY